MLTVLLATHSGCRTFTDSGEGATELAGHMVFGLVREASGSCLAIVDDQQVWRRDPIGAWSPLAMAGIALQSVVSVGEGVYAGGMEEAALLRLSSDGRFARVSSFDSTPGCEKWFAGGPPLGVRSLAAISLATTPNAEAILAGVHVGGIPLSVDGGESWLPTIPIEWDVHQVSGHPTLPGFAAAAAAVGICISHDGGETWRAFTNGDPVPNALALAVLEDEVLFSVQDGPFAKRSQIWRWRRDDQSVTQVRDGLPEWLEGKVDTGWIAAGSERAAVVDRGGNLWLSTSGSTGWKQLASIGEHPLSLGLV